MRSKLPKPSRFAAWAGAVIIGTLPAHDARAAEWRYCLAQSPGQHTVYVSAPFADDQSMEATEAEFGQALDHALLSHETVQCPLGNAQSIAEMKAQAIRYNQTSGNKVVQFNWQPQGLAQIPRYRDFTSSLAHSSSGRAE